MSGIRPRITEKQTLVESVATLSSALRRPVSSKDLIVFWQNATSLRPFLIQRPGQLLIKAARICPHEWGTITRIGIIGNLTYYAPEAHDKWQMALTIHRLRLGLMGELRRAMPSLARNLLYSQFAPMARNALAGWYEEWAKPMIASPELCSELSLHLDPLIQIASEYRAKCFQSKSLPNPITRKEAEQLLRQEYSDRLEWTSATQLSPNKHLVRLKHPRSSLVRTMGYRELEVLLYCQARWTRPEEDALHAKSLHSVLAYGCHAAPHDLLITSRLRTESYTGI